MASTPIALNVKTVNLKGVGDLTIAMRNDKQTPSGIKIAEAFQRVTTGLADINSALSTVSGTVPATPDVPYVTPSQFGGIGDGTTDETTVWKQVIAASLATGKPILGDGKTYLVSKQGTSVIPFSGNTRAYVFLLTAPITIEGYVNFKVDQTNITDGPPSIFFFKQVTGARVNGVTATGIGTQTFPPILYSGVACLFDRCTNCQVNQIRTFNMRGNTLFFQSTECSALNCFASVTAVFLTTSGSHFASYSSSQISFENCDGYGGTGDGDFTHFGSPAFGNQFLSCHAYNYQFGDVSRAIVNPGNQGILLDSGQSIGRIADCYTYGYYYGADVKTTGEDNAVINSIFEKCKVGIAIRLGEGNAPTYNTFALGNTIRPLGGNGDTTPFGGGLTHTLGIFIQDARAVTIDNNWITSSMEFGNGEQDYIPIYGVTTQAISHEDTNGALRITNNHFLSTMDFGGVFTFTRNAAIYLIARADAPWIRTCILGNDFKCYLGDDILRSPVTVQYFKQLDFGDNDFSEILGNFVVANFLNGTMLRVHDNSFDFAPGFLRILNSTIIGIRGNQFGGESRGHDSGLPVPAIWLDTVDTVTVMGNSQNQGNNNDDGYFLQSSASGNTNLVIQGNNLKKNLFLPFFYQWNGVDDSSAQDVINLGNILNGRQAIGNDISTRTYNLSVSGGNWIINGEVATPVSVLNQQTIVLDSVEGLRGLAKLNRINATTVITLGGTGFSLLEIVSIGDASSTPTWYVQVPYDLTGAPGDFEDFIPIYSSVNETGSTPTITIGANQALNAHPIAGQFSITFFWNRMATGI